MLKHCLAYTSDIDTYSSIRSMFFFKSFYYIVFFSPLLPFLCQTEQLLEFMHQLPAFANMTMSVRRDLCSVMMFEVVEQAGTVILHNKQEVRLNSYIHTQKLVTEAHCSVKIQLWAHYFIPQKFPVREAANQRWPVST